MKIAFSIPGIPKAKQSFRFTKQGFKYQPKEIKQNENNLQYAIIQSLPENFVVTEKPIAVTKLHYIFPPLKGFSKSKISMIETGIIIHKDTKPDLTDNLSKMLFDTMQGIVYRNDSQIVSMDNVKKYYGFNPRIELEMEVME